MERRHWSNEFTRGTKKQIKKEQKHKCGYCGQANCFLEVHHIIPVNHGGTRDRDNGVALCVICHQYFDNLALHEHRYFHEVVLEEGKEYVLPQAQEPRSKVA